MRGATGLGRRGVGGDAGVRGGGGAGATAGREHRAGGRFGACDRCVLWRCRCWCPGHHLDAATVLDLGSGRAFRADLRGRGRHIGRCAAGRASCGLGLRGGPGRAGFGDDRWDGRDQRRRYSGTRVRHDACAGVRASRRTTPDSISRSCCVVRKERSRSSLRRACGCIGRMGVPRLR